MGTLLIDHRHAACDLAAGDRPGRCAWDGRPLPARRRRWCSNTCGQAYADNHVWASARQAALERAGYRCERCAAVPLDGLEVHHRVEVDPQIKYRPSCAHHQSNLEVLCPDDHGSEHSFRREVDRLLVWADRHVSRQLVLPGV